MPECTLSTQSATVCYVGQLCNILRGCKTNLYVLFSRHGASIQDVLISPSLLQPGEGEDEVCGYIKWVQRVWVRVRYIDNTNQEGRTRSGINTSASPDPSAGPSRLVLLLSDLSASKWGFKLIYL